MYEIKLQAKASQNWLFVLCGYFLNATVGGYVQLDKQKKDEEARLTRYFINEEEMSIEAWKNNSLQIYKFLWIDRSKNKIKMNNQTYIFYQI